MWRHMIKLMLFIGAVWSFGLSPSAAGEMENAPFSRGKEVVIYVTTMSAPHLNPTIHSGSSIARAGAQIFATPCGSAGTGSPGPTWLKNGKLPRMAFP